VVGLAMVIYALIRPPLATGSKPATT
jgi:hypothetical protein